MAQFSNIYDIDLQERAKYPRVLLQPIGEGDANGSRVGARVTNGGEYVALGGQCVGEVIRPDGSTVPLNGVIAGNEAYVVLDQECCSIVGHIQVSVMWVSGRNVTTLLIAYGTVVNTQTGYIVQPSEPILDLPQLLAQMQRLEAANERADEIDATIQAIRTDTAPYTLRTNAGLSWHTGGYAIVREESAGTPGDMVLTNNASFAATDFIHIPQVASSEIYFAAAMRDSYNAVSFYDESKAYIGGSRSNTGARIPTTIPDGAAYFRLSTNTSVLPLADAYIEFSAVIFGAYLQDDTQKTLFDQVRNLGALDREALGTLKLSAFYWYSRMQLYYLASSPYAAGDAAISPIERAVTDFIAIDPSALGSTLRTNAYQDGNLCAIAFYDSDKAFIFGTQATTEATVSIPATAAYFRLGTDERTRPRETVWVELRPRIYSGYLDTRRTTESIMMSLTGNSVDTQYFSDLDWLDNMMVNYTSGALVPVSPSSSEAAASTVLMPVPKGVVSARVMAKYAARNNNAGFAWYDENGNYLGSGGRRDSLSAYDVVMPDGAAYWRLSITKALCSTTDCAVTFLVDSNTGLQTQVAELSDCFTFEGAIWEEE